MWHIFEQSLSYVMEQELKESSRPLSDNQRRVAVSGWRMVASFIVVQMEIGFYNSDDSGAMNISSQNKRASKVEVVDSVGCCRF
uniref:Uncharacterized protein n=1 Tax=Romanomermis culicivorax TaxID=13658 RepID=A0A915KCB6_ROMCU